MWTQAMFGGEDKARNPLNFNVLIGPWDWRYDRMKKTSGLKLGRKQA